MLVTDDTFMHKFKKLNIKDCCIKISIPWMINEISSTIRCIKQQVIQRWTEKKIYWILHETLRNNGKVFQEDVIN